MFSIVLWMGCSEPSDPKVLYQTTQTIEDTGDVEPVDTGSADTGTGEEEEEELHRLYFKTTNISCSDLDNYAVSLTQVIPGGLEQEADDDGDVRNDLLSHVDLEYTRTGYSEFLDIDKDDLNPSSGCYFSITLPEDVPGNLQDMIAVGEDLEELGEDVGKWSFYAIALVTNEKIACGDPSATIIDCSLSAQPPLSSIDYTQSNPELEDGDIYIWLSDVYLSYVTGVISPSLQDMGFFNGWNLADISDGVMTVVESFDEESTEDSLELMPISITLSDLVPKYSMSLSVENDWSNVICDSSSTEPCTKNQLGLRPSSWIVYGVESSSLPYSYKNLYYNGLGTSTLTENLELQVWGVPANEFFFSGSEIATESQEYNFFQQWGDYVDVAAKAPVVYEANYDGATNTESWASKSTAPKGAMCRGTERIVFAYYGAADELAEALWYRLSGITPGWKVLYGTQGQIDTWRFMVPSTIGATDYSDLQISTSCSVPNWN